LAVTLKRNYLSLPAETQTTSPDSDRIAAGEKGGNFKATVQAIQAMSHPVRMPSQKGGEGVRRLVESREHDSKLFGLNTEYWQVFKVLEATASPLLTPRLSNRRS